MRQPLLSEDSSGSTGSLNGQSYWASFPPLFVRPGVRGILSLAFLAGGVVAAIQRWQDVLAHHGFTGSVLAKYLSIPIVSVLFTYFHIWAALWMTFYPLTFRGCLQIPGTNAGCGWQGIVPSKAEMMARKSVHLMTTKLLDVREVFARLDPMMVAVELDPVLNGMLSTIIHEVAMQEEPAVWASLPAMVKNELILKAREEAPPVIREMMIDVQNNIERVFDLTDMVVKALVNNPGLLCYMFIKCGYDELTFIRNCGAYMGGVFGVIQVALWAVYSRGWMLPAFGLVVGLLSNWIALKMIFEPVEPRRYLGGRLVLQGLFLKRQAEVSAEYGRIVSSRVLSAKYLIPAVITGRCSDVLFELVHKHVQASCDSYAGISRPVIKLVSGREKYDRCKRLVGERIIASLPDTMIHVERYMDSAMDLENLLRDRMTSLSSREFEDLLHPVFQEDEWKLVLMGGALGVIVGFMQWYALGS
mmetsp:Transcript_46030/g.103538  ORF Transcript_46030/g.103538 Transcript_46030/m.103538 type:complete len:473 (-) Transcript_46030:173-1591(-)